MQYCNKSFLFLCVWATKVLCDGGGHGIINSRNREKFLEFLNFIKELLMDFTIIRALNDRLCYFLRTSWACVINRTG
ncbi:MAG: hypothetical protein EBT45_00820 [Alphaproteobacteria bacterium]|nr:hypothetical protein [Alphaproteobacteria bacterium]